MRDYLVIRSAGGRSGRIDPEHLADLRPYLPDPRMAISRNGTRLKRKGSRSLTLTAGGFLVKHFYPRNLWRRLLHTLLPAPATNAWRNHRSLAAAGFPVPRALASLVVRRPYPLYSESFFILENLPGTTNLRDHLIAEHALYASSDPRRLEPFRQAAELIARFHRLGWFHQDLNSKNVLLGPDGRAWLIDFDGSLRFGGLAYHAFLLLRFVDLRRFCQSLRFWIRRTDRERFLLWYFAHFPNGPAERRLFHLYVAVTAFLSGYHARRDRRDRKAALALGLAQPDPPR